MPVLPLRLYAEIAAFLILVCGALWVVHHERQIGADKVVAAQKAADLKEEKHVKQVNADAKVSEHGLQVQLSTALATRPEPSFPVWVCPSTPAAPGAPRSDAPPIAGSNGQAGPGEGVGTIDLGLDIAPLTETILDRDKALIDYLQGYIRKCQDMGNCEK